MNLEQLKQKAQKDMKIDKEHLDSEALRVSDLHNEYLRYYTDAGLELKKKTQTKNKLYRDLWLYYTGQASPEKYQEKQEIDPNIKILKQDVKIYIDGDPEYIQMKTEIAELEAKVEFLEKTVSSIDRMGFQIKNAIDWKKYLQGYNF